MYIDDLLEVFKKASSGYESLLDEGFIVELRLAIEAKKYDLQDEGIIEAILRSDSDELIDSFEQGFDGLVDRLEGISKEEYLGSKEAKKEAINIYITSLESLINLYYNGLIGRHFSAS